MVEPNIVFCSFNHIYDAALHAECPYCKKIKEDQAALSKSLDEDSENVDVLIDEEDADSTELLDIQGDSQDADEDESTELLTQSSDEDESTELLIQETDEDESTELLIPESDEDEETELVNKSRLQERISKTSNKSSKPVLGWLVCNSGRQIGRSYEIVEGKNFIYIDENHVNVLHDSSLMNGVVAELTADVLKNEFYISTKDNREMVINGQVSRNSIIRNYDACEINSVKFVFVELMTEFVNWGI